MFSHKYIAIEEFRVMKDVRSMRISFKNFSIIILT